MKRNDFLQDAIGCIDDDLIADARQPAPVVHKKRRSLLLIAAALILAVAIIAGGVVAYNRGNTTPGEDNIPIVNLQTPSASPVYYGKKYSTGSSGSGAAEFNTTGFAVTARLIETLPDTYTFFDDWEQAEFRLLRMETVKLLNGEEMTDEFLFIIPVNYMTDYSVYDCFVIRDMWQYCYDYSVLYNKTQGCAESMNIVIFGHYTSSCTYLNKYVMAFDKFGFLDTNLWGSTERWKDSTGYPDVNYSDFYTLKQAEKAAVYEYYNNYRVGLLKDVTGDAAKALEYVKNPENGLFVPSSKHFNSGEVSLRFRKYINGFPTDETVMIYSDKAIYSDAQFTKEHENTLSDLRSAINSVYNAYNEGKISPPHIEFTSQISTYGIIAWYAKTPDGIIGIVRVTWAFRCDDSWAEHADYIIGGPSFTHFDDKYYIVESDSEVCTPIDRDALLELLDNYQSGYIYTNEYNEFGRVKKNYFE